MIYVIEDGDAAVPSKVSTNCMADQNWMDALTVT